MRERMDEIPTRALLAFVRLGSARSVKIAFRVVLSGRYCVSCGIVGWNRVWCALQTLTKPNFIRNLRTKRKCDRRIPHQARFRPKGSHQAQKRPKQPAPSEISAGTPAKIAFRAGSSAGIGFGARYRPPRSRIPSEISAPSANATEESRTKRKCDRSGPHQARFRPKNPEPSANATEVARTKRDSDRRIPNQAQVRPKWDCARVERVSEPGEFCADFLPY